ncbi:hypothetical protein CAPTEDRAFT_151000 [Capitella teleta]|uniref:BTB domain-containing protein n=1 Tax=Capitella teleta TaxID=283909 RepID=R7U2V9_CAPTE|nr:hypothetical protein CAPTEDRAFT_151000 [Capitella teleta]|eukprot:ELU00416.1 hypothetical protein CAPTEDRAFT_151000 [Capitella teleta]
MADDVIVFHKQDLPLMAFPMFEEIRRRGKLCDVTLLIEEQRIHAHRIVLAATVPYFNAMFTHDMVESKQNEIAIKGIEASALSDLVTFAYSGSVQIDSMNVQNLLVGASFLQMQVIKDACCDFMKSRLHPNNVLGIKSFADQFMCRSLEDACDKYIQIHFMEVSKSEEFLSLDEDRVTAILARDQLHITGEEQVFEAAINWVKQQSSKRMHHLPNLVVHVRLPLLSPQFLSDRVGQEELIKGSLKCRDLLDEARDFHLMPERRAQLQTFKTRPRCCTDVVGVIYAVGGLTSSGDSISTVEFYDPIIGKWQMAKPMSTLRSRVGIAVLKGHLYAIGGYDGQERLNTVEVFDPVKLSWGLVAPMICKRSALGAGALGGELYVCGGYDGVTSLSSVEKYDPVSNKWVMVSNMIRHRSAAGVCVLNGHIYALGGHDGLSIFDSAERFDGNGQWKAVASMLSKRCRLGVASLNGKLYAAGGYDGNVFLKQVECYDPNTDSWCFVAPMNVKRSRVALVTNCGKLYAIGGYDGVSNLNSVEVYDPSFNTWNFSASMCAHEGGVGVGVVPVDAARS